MTGWRTIRECRVERGLGKLCLPPVGSAKATVEVDPTGSHDCAE